MGLMDFFGDSIRVMVLGTAKRGEIRTCSVKKNQVHVERGVEFDFKTEDVGSVWVRTYPSFRHAWVECVLWREGAKQAMPWGNKEDYVPPITEDELGELTKQMVVKAKARDKGGALGGKIGYAILILLIITTIFSLLTLMGVHMNLSTGQQTVTTILKPTPTPIVIP